MRLRVRACSRCNLFNTVFRADDCTHDACQWWAGMTKELGYFLRVGWDDQLDWLLSIVIDSLLQWRWVRCSTEMKKWTSDASHNSSTEAAAHLSTLRLLTRSSGRDEMIEVIERSRKNSQVHRLKDGTARARCIDYLVGESIARSAETQTCSTIATDFLTIIWFIRAISMYIAIFLIYSR